jgi:hypothetical protein
MERLKNTRAQKRNTFSYIKQACKTTVRVDGERIDFCFNVNNGKIIRNCKDGSRCLTCSFVNDEDEFCTNIAEDIFNGYCEKHQNGVKNYIKSTTEIGNERENIIFEILTKYEGVVNVENIGSRCGSFDIIFQLNDEVKAGLSHYRGVQIKSIYYHNGCYRMNINRSYPDDMLIIGVGDNGRRCIYFFNELNTDTTKTLPYNTNNPYFERLFDGINIVNKYSGLTFEETLFNLIERTAIFDESSFSFNYRQELKGYEILKNKCKDLGLTFKYKDTHESVIDCYINDKSVQCKVSSTKHPNSPSTITFKLEHKIDGQSKPYDDSVDFFCLIPLTDELKDNPIVYMIPKQFMIESNHIKSETSEGQIYFGLRMHENVFKQFEDNFESFLSNSEESHKFKGENNIANIFKKQCKCVGINFIPSGYNNALGGRIGNYTFIFRTFTNRSTGTSPRPSLQCSNLAKGYNIETAPDFFILTASGLPNFFVIFPKQILIDMGYITSDIKDAPKSFSITVPDKMSSDNWAKKYINNFGQLKNLPNKLNKEEDNNGSTQNNNHSSTETSNKDTSDKRRKRQNISEKKMDILIGLLRNFDARLNRLEKHLNVTS